MLKVLWTCLELCANVLDAFLCIHFIIRSFEMKCRILNLKVTYAIGIISTTALTTLFNSVTLFEGILGMGYAVLFFCFSVFFLKGALRKKIFITALTVICLISTASISGGLLLAVFRDDYAVLYNKFSIERFLFIVIGLGIRAYIFALLTRMTADKDFNLRYKEWALILSVLGISFVVMVLIYMILVDTATSSKFLGILMSAELGIIIINILCLYITANLSETHKSEEAMLIEKKRVEYSQKYAQDIKEQYVQTRRLRHDMKQYAVLLLSSVRKGNIEAVEELAQKISAETTADETIIKVDNDFVNAILNTKLSYAKSLGIDVFCSVGNGIWGVDDIDLCNLLGNLLDNAITAARECNENLRLIETHISTFGSSLRIVVKNSVPSSVLAVNPKLKTTKSDSDEHGFGLKTIKSIAEKYDSVPDFYEEGCTFICRVDLHKKSEAK